MNINKKHLKEVKRKRTLQKRIKCHGNNMECDRVHPKKVKRISTVKPTVNLVPESSFSKPKKKGILSRLFGK